MVNQIIIKAVGGTDKKPLKIMGNCVLCSQELTFMNASVGKLSDGGKVCRACFKKITKVNPSINIKRYSLVDIKDILQGKEIQSPKIDKIEKPKKITIIAQEEIYDDGVYDNEDYFITRFGKRIPADEAYKARESNDFNRMVKAAELETNTVDRHFLLQGIISESYRLRKDEYYSNLCVKFSEIHLSEFPILMEALKDEFGDLPRVLVFQNYSTVLTEIGEYEKAINVCEMAISFGLEDGTKGGYQGRIDKIKKKIFSK